MRLYSGTSNQFIEDNVRNQIAEKLRNEFFNYFRYYPHISEVKSWENSLSRLALVFQSASLTDHGILLEYQLPLNNRRLDCLICGMNQKNRENAVIIELKQWSDCNDAEGENEVATFVAGKEKELLHPSVQVGGYKVLLQDNISAFYEENPIELNACAYLHNYTLKENDALLNLKFKNYLAEYPLFSQDDVPSFQNYLKDRLSGGNGVDILKKVEQSKFRPSKKLMEHVAKVIRGKSEYTLLDEQLIAYDKVFACVKSGFHDKKKRVIIIKGGPGTGKSVIAINLMAELTEKGYNAHYATGSRAFTETLRKSIGSRASCQFKYFNSYIQANPNEIDVLLCDESHRIRETSNSLYTRADRRSDKPQIEELLNSSKVSVFFIDDHQIVRPNEIGSVEHIKKAAQKVDAPIFEYELELQFRCAGSESFINWINNTLGVEKNGNVLLSKEDNFEFKIMSSPDDVEKEIRIKIKEGNTGRITAGFCWPWSKGLNPDGSLVSDVSIGYYTRPWNARPDATGLQKDIPKADIWAYDPNGINQIGCIYTAQGFEFDYVGVIWGEDLTYNLDNNIWEAHTNKSYDTIVKKSGEKFIDLVKNTYRVLLSRGMKGCYVYFVDKDTERFVRSRME